MSSEAAQPRRSSVGPGDCDADPAFENEMHRSGRVALPGNDVAGRYFQMPAMFGEAVAEIWVTESLRQPAAQGARVVVRRPMQLDDFLFAGFQRPIEIRCNEDVIGDEPRRAK